MKRPDLTGDASVGRMAAVAVLTVGACAAIVSYIHISDLAAAHGSDWLAAHLLPVAIDGTVAAATLQMLRAGRQKVPVDWLQRTMLGLSVAATVAANVAYGWPDGAMAAAIDGTPALFFIGSVEMAVRSIRRQPAAAKPARKRAAKREDVRASGGRDGGRRTRNDHRIEDRAAAILAARPGISGRELGAELGRSERHGRRLLRQLAARPEGRAA